MAGPRLNALKKQFDSLKESIETINRAVEARGGDLTDEEKAAQDTAFAEIDRIKPEIEAETTREESLKALAEVVAKHAPAARTVDRSRPQGEATLPSAAEYIGEYLTAYASGQLDEFVDRMGIVRADQGTTNNAGILPKPIVGNLISFLDASRPVFGSMTSRPMPRAGKTFARPRITQHVTVTEQDAEFDALDSQVMTITSDDVTKRTFGGQLDISQQDIDWTDPAILQVVINDFSDIYAQVTETAAKEYLGTLPTTFSPWTASSPGTIVESFVDGAVAVYGQCKRFPDTVWLDLVTWGELASTTNTNNDTTALALVRKAFDETGFPQPRFVVAPGLDTDGAVDGTQAVVMGVSSLVESYEQTNGLLRVEQPGTLSQKVAYYGYVAFYGRPEGVIYLGTEDS